MVSGSGVANTAKMHEMTSSRVTRVPFGAARWLLTLCVAALLVRAVCAVFFTGEIDTEGAGYASIARNLLAGNGYVMIGIGGPNLFFPPLFPILIAAVTLITGEAEIAARAVSVMMGGLLSLPVYAVARRMYGVRIALGAAALTAFHPSLVQFSTTGFCEPTYLTLLLTALACVMRALDRPSGRNMAVSGGCYGLAYLVRPEVLIFMLIGMAYIVGGRVLLRDGSWRVVARRILLVPIVFLIFAGPYIAWLSIETGQFRFEGKSPFNNETIMRMQRGASLNEARLRVDPDLTPVGVTVQPNVVFIKSYHAGLRDLVGMIATKAKPALRDAVAAISGNLAFGVPPLFGLAILGLFGFPWRPRMLLDQCHILMLLALSIFGTLFIFYSDPRFYLSFVVFFCIWGSAGLAVLARWARDSARLSGATVSQQTWIGVSASVVAVAAIVAASLPPALGLAQYSRATRAIKYSGESLINLANPPRIADTQTSYAFHAKAGFSYLPQSDESTALRYLKKLKVTHVVLRETALSEQPYLGTWWKMGVPDAVRIQRLTVGPGQAVDVYQFHPDTPG